MNAKDIREVKYMNKAMPIGVDDFKKVRENYYFVDKTDFIRQLIDSHYTSPAFRQNADHEHVRIFLFH